MSDFEPGVAQPQPTLDQYVSAVRAIAANDEFWSAPTGNPKTHYTWLQRKFQDALAGIEQSDPTYQWQVFDTKRSRVVMEVPAEDLGETKKSLKWADPNWVLRRRVVGPWEEVN